MAGFWVIRVRTHETIEDARIRSLIFRAVAVTKYPGTTAQAFYDEIADGITGDMLGVFVGYTERAPKAIAIATLPYSAMMMAPQVVLAYSERRELSVKIGQRIRGWVALHDYDRVLGINLWHDDDAFCRVFRHLGEPKVIGSLMEFKL